MPELTATTVDYLQRFIDLDVAIQDRRRWFQGALPFRFAALTLATTTRPPAALADDIQSVAAELKRHGGWYSPLQSEIRFLIAAILLHQGADPAEFCADVARCRPMFKSEKLGGGVYTVFSTLLLRAQRKPI